MHAIIDRLLLLIGCFFLLDLSNQIELSLAVVIIAVSISEFTYALKSHLFFHTSTIAFMIACILEPTFFWLLPLVLYESVLRKKYIYLLFTGLIYVFYFTDMDTFQRFYLFFLFGFMLILGLRTIERRELHKKYIKLNDDSRQMERIMIEKNREIEANQDAEIHLATLQERNRIAREIHDNVGHMLSRSILMVGACIAINKEEQMNDCLNDLKDTLDSAMNSIRSSVHDLHDDSIDLEEGIRQIVQGFTFCKMTLDYDMGRDVDRKVKFCFISILKEACANIIKHSNATNVEVVLREHPAIYQLLISDNGTTENKVSTDGIGLSNMQERVQGLNGTITITKENGYRIFVMIPKNRKKDERM